MIIEVDTTGTVAEFKKIFTSLQRNKNAKGLLILACDGNGFTPNNINTILKQSKIPVFGGIFPQIIAGQKRLEN